MRKTIFFTKLNYHKLEEKLSQLEREGLRLTAVRSLYQFEFAECKGKDTKYFCVYNFMKEYRSGECEKRLVSEHQASRVSGTLSIDGTTTIYRTAKPDCDFSDLSADRDKYLLRVFIKKLFISSLFLVLALIVLLDACPDRLGCIITLSVGAVSALFTAWNIYGLAVLFIRNKKSENGGGI